MKRISTIFLVLVTLSLAGPFVLGQMSRSGQAAGILDGRLKLCPDKPNCVCSEYREDGEHFVEPLEFSLLAPGDVNAAIRGIIREMGGRITTEREDYMAATFHSPLFGFVDDLEIRIDAAASLIHIRSASRVGYGDFGANRKRTEKFRKLFLQG